MNLTQLSQSINTLLKKDLAFAIYGLPDENREFTLVCQTKKDIKEIDILDIDEFSGFVVAPFKSAQTGMGFLIQPDFVAQGDDLPNLINEFAQNFPDVEHEPLSTENHIISHHAYINNAEYLINLLQKEQLHKVVYTRVMTESLPENFLTGEFFRLLAETYADTFVCLYHLPGRGTWIVASPESLLEVDQKEASTMALAGTRLYHPETTSQPWAEKDANEQSYVSQFICNLLSEIGITNYHVGKPTTKKAGHLEHRLTCFTIPIDELADKTGKIIMGLHPTPAVCGFPKGDAYHLIMRAELHDRRFYTGFLGPWKLNGNSKLFVNLRCAELGENTINLYVGGGLTAESNAEKEWDETLLKSQTLLSVMEKM